MSAATPQHRLATAVHALPLRTQEIRKLSEKIVVLREIHDNMSMFEVHKMVRSAATPTGKPAANTLPANPPLVAARGLDRIGWHHNAA